MTEPRDPSHFLVIEPDGRVFFSERVMEDFVVETLGCVIFFNDKDIALAFKLLRGEDDPPYRIERLPAAEGGTRGVLDAGPFLAKVGLDIGPSTLTLPCRFYRKYHSLEVQIGGGAKEKDREKKGILDDFPAIED